MPKYLLQVSYTLDGVKGVVSKGGSARKAAAQAAAESIEETLESFYFAFGGDDVFTVADLPDNAAAAALALNVTASRRRHGSHGCPSLTRGDRRGDEADGAITRPRPGAWTAPEAVESPVAIGRSGCDDQSLHEPG